MKEDRQISLTVCLYRGEPLARYEFAIKALGAATAERKARDAEEQVYCLCLTL